MWEKVPLADRSVQYRAEKPRTLDELFAKLSTPETERLSVQLRKQLGEPGAGEVASLQQLRLQAGMSQKQLAAVLGADQGYVSRLENGNIVDPSLSRARALAKALGVSIELIDLAFERFAESENNV